MRPAPATVVRAFLCPLSFNQFADFKDAVMRQDRGVLYGGAAIAAYTGLPRRAVYSLAELGQLPVFRAGATVCATPALLDDWLARREVEARRNTIK